VHNAISVFNDGEVNRKEGKKKGFADKLLGEILSVLGLINAN
jgi:hypothetical protein